MFGTSSGGWPIPPSLHIPISVPRSTGTGAGTYVASDTAVCTKILEPMLLGFGTTTDWTLAVLKEFVPSNTVASRTSLAESIQNQGDIITYFAATIWEKHFLCHYCTLLNHFDLRSTTCRCAASMQSLTGSLVPNRRLSFVLVQNLASTLRCFKGEL